MCFALSSCKQAIHRRVLCSRHVTRELPYNVPYGAKAQLIVKCFEQWEELAFHCADQVIRACKTEALKAVDTIFGGFSFSSLDRASA